MQQKFDPTLTTFQVLPHPLRPAASWPLEGQWPPAAARRNWGDRLWQLKIRATLKKDTLKLDRDWIMTWESTMENMYQQLKNYETLFIKFCGHIYLPLFLYVFLRGKHNDNSIIKRLLWYYLTKHRWFVIPPSPTAAKAVVSQSAGGCLRAFARPFTWRSLPRVACLQISPWIIYRQVLRPDR